ncbi:hypothetical protein O1R50_07215 [Glycomyces luteolus]|uniref:Uncharacterized protein n=1 Tax=Glycomyces luteolus TaxID=2670330 RepID=A0A9X3P5X8_9ACTN|nr:hypothetical protein [Glycomyces luteolus]MDA1359403.1 hypothetical protein [Glycomyces luteolus]
MELSIGQVLAAAGATVLGAILAKLLGLWGTLAGTAVLSVCSSIGAVLILRAMRRTGEKIKAQITALAPVAKGKAPAVTVELNPDTVTATAKIPDTQRHRALREDTIVLGTNAADTDEIVVAAEPAPEGHVTKTQSNQRTLIAILVSSVLVFSLTVAALYLLGALTGEPDRFITNDNPQTIVSEAPVESGTPESTETTEAPTESATPSETPTSEAPTETTAPTESATTETPSQSPTPDAGSSTGGTEETTSPTPQDGTVTETPATE